MKGNPVAQDVEPRLRLPKTATRDEVIEIRTLITHPMESGLRRDENGQPIPRAIIDRLSVTFNGIPVIDLAIEPAISANPYFAFQARIPESGEFVFAWHGDDGAIHEARRRIEVV